MENIDLGSVVNIVLTIITVIAGGLWLKAKGKLGQLKSAAKESYEAISAVVDALGDDKITAEEQVIIKKEANEAWGAIKLLLGIKK